MLSLRSWWSRRGCHSDPADQAARGIALLRRPLEVGEIPAVNSSSPDTRPMGRGAGVGETTAVRRRPGQGVGGGRPLKWTDKRIEEELGRLVERNGGRFPSAIELQDAGLSGLRRAIGRRGIAFWASWLDIPLAPGQDRSPYGHEEALADARAVLVKEGRIPGTNRLRDLGHPRLAGFIVKEGGVKKFSARFEVPRTLS